MLESVDNLAEIRTGEPSAETTIVQSAPSPPTAPDAKSAGPATKPLYPLAAVVPTQAGPDGIRFDFNRGCRVMLPARTEGTWRVRLRDLDTGNTLFQSENAGALVSSAKRWFVRFRIEVWLIEQEGAEPRPILTHDYNPRDRDVLVQFPVGTLGDILAWFPYAARFAERHPDSRITCALSDKFVPLLRDAYPNLRLLTHEELAEQRLADRMYATYSLGLFFNDTEHVNQPTDFRQVGLHRTAGYILGVDPIEEAPRIVLSDNTRPVAEPYVCIATQSSTQCKYWNNPNGWREVVGFLKENGYRVICIDQKPLHGSGLIWNHIPHGTEDETGDRPLAERARK